MNLLGKSLQSGAPAVGHSVPQDLEITDENEPTAVTASGTSSYGSGDLDVPLVDIVRALKSNVKFKMSVITYMAHSVGIGYYITTAANNAGRKAKQLIMDFEEDFDLDEINQKIGRDVWASGNAFLNVIPEDRGETMQENRGLNAVYMLPLSSIKKVNRNKYGQVTEYIQQWGGKHQDVPSGDIAHFIWLPLDEDWKGEGIGQILLRRGLGYRTHSGKWVYRPTWFESQEMIDDISVKMTYSGLPRYATFFDGLADKRATKSFIDSQKTLLNKLDPLQNYLTNVKGDIKEISLSTNGKFDSFIRHIDDNIITGTMSPLIRLWSNMDFTYASSKSAVEAMDPLIGMYRRAHFRFIEKHIFMPLLESANVNLKNADFELTWGNVEPPTIESLKMAWDLINSSDKFEGLYDPKKFMNAMSAILNIDITPEVEEETKVEVDSNMQLVKMIEGGRERYISSKELRRASKRVGGPVIQTIDNTIAQVIKKNLVTA